MNLAISLQSIQECYLYSNCDDFDPEPALCPDCVSGEASCSCFFPGLCLGLSDGTAVTGDEIECQGQCFDLDGCEWFSFHRDTGACTMLEDCEEVDPDRDGYVSGPKVCQGETSTTSIDASTTRPDPGQST